MSVNLKLLHGRTKHRHTAADAPKVATADGVPPIKERMLKLAGLRDIHDEAVMHTGPVRAAVAKRTPIGFSQGSVVFELGRDVRIWNAGQPRETGPFLGVDFAEKEVEKPVHLSPPPKPDNGLPFTGRGRADDDSK